ncbi:hypothetical protein [Streptomyces sp. SudanB91_2054]|uniref:hypothetical protein n=1 Tax=Streptomyces sp. SudanB91_2054 TaxID=3035278 RepID=UPI0036D78716
MGRRERAAEEQQETEERSALAGAVVVVAFGALVFGVLFAVSDAAGILAVVVAATAAVWWSVTRKGTNQPLPSPTVPLSPEDELPGHGPIAVSHREGLSIYVRDDGTNPARTHVRVVRHDQDA